MEWGHDTHISVTCYSAFDSVHCSIHNSTFEQLILTGDPSSSGVVTWYNFYIGRILLPRFYNLVTLVWPVLNQRLEIETHSIGTGESGVERDIHIHIPNPKFACQIIMVTVGCADTLGDVRTKLIG
eukprot:11940012-Ditylum_brightwellii.AAC.2